MAGAAGAIRTAGVAGAAEVPEDLAELAAVVDKLAGQPLERLAGLVRAHRLRWLIDRLQGQ